MAAMALTLEALIKRWDLRGNQVAQHGRRVSSY
jgi:hypothetical protein